MTHTWKVEYIPLGIQRIEHEISVVNADLRGFKSFYKEVSNISASNVESVFNEQNALSSKSEQTTIAEIRDAYEQTVMDVNHYEEEYGDSFQESLIIEFGAVGEQFVYSDIITPEFKNRFLSCCESVIQKRTAYKKDLRKEYETLVEMEEELSEVGNRIISIDTQGNQKKERRELQSKCDRLASARQRELRMSQTNRYRFIGQNLNQYLYEPLPVAYPILADIAAAGEFLQNSSSKRYQPP